MKPSKPLVLSVFLAGTLLACVIYSAIYVYLRTDDWIDHDAKWKFINYSTGYVYAGHTVELKRQYQDNFDFSSIEGFTLPGRFVEKQYWEIKYPKGTLFPKEWKLPEPDKDWMKVLQIGKSRSETAYSELQNISKSNKDLPSGKLAATMIELWDPQLRTFISSEPRSITDVPWYAINKIGHYRIKLFVKKDGHVVRACIFRTGEIEKSAEEIVQHTLYCPAKDIKDYIEAFYEFYILAC